MSVSFPGCNRKFQNKFYLVSYNLFQSQNKKRFSNCRNDSTSLFHISSKPNYLNDFLNCCYNHCLYNSHFSNKQVIIGNYEYDFKSLCQAENLQLLFCFRCEYTDKLLFKNYFHFFDFANMNDKMTGASTALGLRYNVSLGCLVSSVFSVSCVAQRKVFIIFPLTLSKHIKIIKEINLYFWLTPLLMVKGG